MSLLERISGAWGALNPPPVSASLELGQYAIKSAPSPAVPEVLSAAVPNATAPAVRESFGIPASWSSRGSNAGGIGILSGSGELTTAGGMIDRLLLPPTVKQFPRYSDLSFLMHYGKMPMLRACAKAKANALSSLKWDYLSARTATGRRALESFRSYRPKDAYQFRHRKLEIAGRLKAGDAKSLTDDDPAVAFFRRGVQGAILGQHFLTGRQIEKLRWLYEIIVGESFNLLERDTKGRPYQRVPLSPYMIRDIAKPGVPWFEIRGLYNGALVNFDQEDVLYQKDPQLFNPFGRGIGDAQAAAMDLLLDDAMARADYARWVNGGRPDMLILGLVSSPEERERIELEYRQKFNGPDRVGKPWFIEGENDNAWTQNVKTIEFQQKNRDLQTAQIRELEQEIIRQVIGQTPPELLGLSKDSNRATVDGMLYLYYKVSINPSAEQEEDFRNEVILPQFGGTIVAQFESASDEDHEHQLEVMKGAPWAFRKKHWFIAAGLEPEGKPDDEAYPVALGQSFTDDLLAPPPKAAVPPPAPPVDEEEPAPQGGKKPKPPAVEEDPEPEKPPAKKAATPTTIRKAPEFKAPDDIADIANRLSPALRAHFVHAISDAQGKVDLVSLRAALSADQFEVAIRMLPLDRLSTNMAQSEVLLRSVLAEAGATAASHVADAAGSDASFDPADAAVGAWASSRSTDLGQWIRNSATQVANGIITNELKTGELNPDQAARAIRDRLGLTLQDSTAVANLRRKQIEDGAEVETANEQADAYAKGKLAERAAGFGEGQAFSAAQEGQRQSWLQSVDNGILPETVMRGWFTQEDADVCPRCDFLEGQKVALGQPFTGPNGEQWMNPGDPHIDTCRCGVILVYVKKAA